MNDLEFMDFLDVFILHITTGSYSETTFDKLNEKVRKKKIKVQFIRHTSERGTLNRWSMDSYIWFVND